MCGAVEEPSVIISFRDAGVATRLRPSLEEALKALPQVARVQMSAERLLVWEPRARSPSPTLCEFVEDTTPTDVNHTAVPRYSRKFSVLDGNTPEKPKPTKISRKQDCFNCSEDHNLRDCPYPRNMDKINQRRNEFKNKYVRYHADDQEKEEPTPGKISKELRHALGLKKHQLPLHIYKMRVLGYPPGWLLNARICHSGLTMFDSHGTEAENPTNNDVKDEYDIEKILDYPGFNVPPGSKYVDESYDLGYPPFNEENSKLLMLDKLAPRAAKAYRRKKLTTINPEQQPGDIPVQTDMDIENEEGEYCMNGYSYQFYMPPLPFIPPLPVQPLLPPLPFDAPPEVPPPPPLEVPLPASPKKIPASEVPLPASPKKIPASEVPLPPSPKQNLPSEVALPQLSSESVSSLPSDEVPSNSVSLDDDANIDENSSLDSSSLNDLECRKRVLLAELENDSSEDAQLLNDNSQSSETPSVSNDRKNHNNADTPSVLDNSSFHTNDSESTKLTETQCDNLTSTPKQGRIRDSSLGTPMYNICEYNSLPSGDSFSKDMSDSINFENLPDSTGKYEQMSVLIKKIRKKVTQLQES